jgi:hypothetical protein
MEEAEKKEGDGKGKEVMVTMSGVVEMVARAAGEVDKRAAAVVHEPSRGVTLKGGKHKAFKRSKRENA